MDPRLLKAAAYMAYTSTRGLDSEDIRTLNAWAETLLLDVVKDKGMPSLGIDEDLVPIGVPPWE